MRNVFAYKRATDIWWRRVGLALWRGGDDFQGVAVLDSVREDEFVRHLERRWTLTISQLDRNDLRKTVYQAFHPAQLGEEWGARGYNAHRVTCWPKSGGQKHARADRAFTSYFDPMPMAF